ncbi:MAG: putative tail-component [Bacteriophage sp.]|nr:MAG: putative tail-component [Bacteriophage sp.]
MAIKPNFTKDDVRKRFDAFLNEIEKKQIARLQRLGEMCLVEARTNKGYMMQTGALLSSTGCEVFVDGVAIHSQFDAASGAESNAAEMGIKSGQSIAETIGKGTKGIALVVVAGMNYAAYVEAKGYNVLSSAEHLAERELPRMLEKLISNIKRAAE